MLPTTTPYPAISTNSATSLLDEFEDLSKLGAPVVAEVMTQLILGLRPHERNFFIADFGFFGLTHQRPPRLANSGRDWLTWLILGGRGAGKTRAGAEWVRSVALTDKHARIALIGETEHEVRAVMVEGVSGLLAVHCDDERPQWLPSLRRVQWQNGAVAEIFSAENPEGLRGPQFSAAWLDELAKWRQVFGLGSTDALSGDVAQWAMIVLTAYFGGRSLEKVARILGRK